MSNGDSAAAWAQLKEAGLVEGEQPQAADVTTPWYVQAMLGIAGWIGAMFLLYFAYWIGREEDFAPVLGMFLIVVVAVLPGWLALSRRFDDAVRVRTFEHRVTRYTETFVLFARPRRGGTGITELNGRP